MVTFSLANSGMCPVFGRAFHGAGHPHAIGKAKRMYEKEELLYADQ